MAPDINFDRLDAFQTRICVFDTINSTPTYARACFIYAISNTGDASSHAHSSARLHQHVGCKSCDDQIAVKRRYGRRNIQFRWLLVGIGAGISGLRQVCLCEGQEADRCGDQRDVDFHDISPTATALDGVPAPGCKRRGNYYRMYWGICLPSCPRLPGRLIPTDQLPSPGSGSFHLRSAQASTNNRLDPAAGAINLLAAVDLEAVGYAFEDSFQISALAFFPCCRAVQCALRARHRRYEPLAFRHDWLPARCPMLWCSRPTSDNPSVTPAVISGLTRNLTIGSRRYS